MREMRKIPNMAVIFVCMFITLFSSGICEEEIHNKVTISDESIDLIECGREPNHLINVMRAIILELGDFDLPDTTTACNATEHFRLACQARATCTVYREDFISISQECDGQAIQFQYSCMSTEGMLNLSEEQNKESRSGSIMSPNYPASSDDLAEARCTIKPMDSSQDLILNQLEVWENLSNISTIGILPNETEVASRQESPHSRYLNYETLLNLPLKQVNISIGPTIDPMLINFTATAEVRLCCWPNSTWRDCDDTVPSNKIVDTKSGGSPPPYALIASVTCGVLICVIAATVIIVVIYMRRRKLAKTPYTKGKVKEKEDLWNTSNETPPDVTYTDRPETANTVKYDNAKSHVEIEGAYSSIDVANRTETKDAPVPSPRKDLKTASHEPSTYLSQFESDNVPIEYATPIPKSQRPAQRPTRLAPALPSVPPPSLTTRAAQKAIPGARSPIELNAPEKPKRLHAGVVEDRKKKIQDILPDTGTGKTPGTRGSVTKWTPNEVYG